MHTLFSNGKYFLFGKGPSGQADRCTIPDSRDRPEACFLTIKSVKVHTLRSVQVG